MRFCRKYQMAQNDLRNIRFPTGWCILCLVCGSKKAVSVSSITNSLQAKQSIKPRQTSNKNHVLAVTHNLSHSTEPSSTAGMSSDVCLDNIPIFFAQKTSLQCISQMLAMQKTKNERLLIFNRCTRGKKAV